MYIYRKNRKQQENKEIEYKHKKIQKNKIRNIFLVKKTINFD